MYVPFFYCTFFMSPRRVSFRLRRCQEFDLEAEEYVPLPKGEVHKKKEVRARVSRLIPGGMFLLPAVLGQRV